MLRGMEHRLGQLTKGLALLGFAGLLTLAVMTTLDVLLRWLWAMPLAGVNDISANVMAVVIAACIPANLLARQNIAVEFLGPLGGADMNRFCRWFASLITLAFVAVMAWKFLPYTEGLYMTQRRTWVLGWMIWPWWAVATACLILAVVVQGLIMLIDLVALITRRDPEVDR